VAMRGLAMGDVMGLDEWDRRSERRLEMENFLSLVGDDLGEDIFLVVVIALVPWRWSGISLPFPPMSLRTELAGDREWGVKSSIAV
jgi:hypothetical protein